MNAKDIQEDVKIIKLHLNGRDYNLRFDLNAFIDLEAEFGDPDDVLNGLAQTPGSDGREPKMKPMAALRALLWAGLRDEIPDLTVREAGRLINLANMGELDKITQSFLAVNEGVTQNMPSPEPSDKAPSSGTGAAEGNGKTPGTSPG